MRAFAHVVSRTVLTGLPGVAAVSLTGSAAVDDLAANSDVDIIAITHVQPGREPRRRLAMRLVEVAAGCPARGLEFVLYLAGALRPPRHPLTYLLNVNAGPRMPVHVSTAGDPAHWFLLDAAMAREQGVPLHGPPLHALVAPAAARDVRRALLASLAWHRAHAPATANTVLNACRAWRWNDDGAWASKTDAGRWVATRPGAPPVVDDALRARAAGENGLDRAATAAFLDAVARRVSGPDTNPNISGFLSS